MRTIRWILTMTLAIGIVAMPGLAQANGGAYFNGVKTYYVAGDPNDPLVASYEAKIPEKHLGILDKGPYHVYVMPWSVGILEGKPIPTRAVLVDTIDISHVKGNIYRFSARFTMPDLPNGNYKIEVCNSPCTVAGFREPIGAYFVVVSTPFEAELLKGREALKDQLNGTSRELRKTTEQLEEMQVDLEIAENSRDTLVTRVTDLEAEVGDLEAQVTSAAAEPEPLIDPWVGGLVAIGLGLLAAAIFRKRGPRAGGDEDTGTPAPDGNGHAKVHDLNDDRVPARR